MEQTGDPALVRGHGFSAWWQAWPAQAVSLQAGYSRSMNYDLDSFFFGVGLSIGSWSVESDIDLDRREWMMRSILILSALGLALAPALSAQGKGRGPAAPQARPPAAPQARPSAPPQSRPPADPGEAARGPARNTHPAPAARNNNGLKPPRDYAKKNNPRLEARLRPMLPPGVDVESAALGFKNTGQFVAATRVSNDLGIPFQDPKARMISGASLGDAIQELRPQLNERDTRQIARDAEREAERIIRDMQTPPPHNGVPPPPQRP